MSSVTTPSFKTEERRKVQRLPANNIDVEIKSRRSNPNSVEFGKVESVDFNRHGVGFITPHCFSIGDEVELLVQTHTGTAEVSGVVCNRSKVNSLYRCGIAFKPVSETSRRTLKSLEVYQAQSQMDLFD